MVTYLPSFATKSIRVMPLEVATNLTLVAIDEVLQGVSFPVAGVLRRSDTNAPLEGEMLTAVYDGTVIGTDMTSATGAYSMTATIPEVGDYTLQVVFEGSVRPGFVLGRSQASGGVSIIGLEIPGLIMGVVAPILVGGALVYLSK